MLIAVTGAAGKLGRATIAELIEAGHGVRPVDRIASPGADSRAVYDLTDAGQAVAALAGCDAIVHLAAWPTPFSASPQVVLSDNVTMSANTLLGGASVGISRAVIASSQSALGLAWTVGVTPPDYLLVDEDHPCRPTDAYSLSKLATEQLAQTLARRGELASHVLRFPVIWDHQEHVASVAARLDRPEQAARSQWAYVDARDAARAIRLALEATPTGCEVLNITSDTAFSTVRTRELVAQWYPGLEHMLDGMPADTACFDWHRAHDRIGFLLIVRKIDCRRLGSAPRAPVPLISRRRCPTVR